MADACPHRLAPLSIGLVEGDNLRCKYHGVLFDGAGRCLEMPGQAQRLGYLKVKTYPVIERYRFIWVWIGEADKAAFLGGAMALLFPIRWPEPFGLVMIEAMACGTPVVAFRCGAVPEVIDDGVSGFVVDDVDQAVAAIGRLAGFDRRRCRATFERRFSDRRMAGDYLALYRRLARRAELSPVA